MTFKTNLAECSIPSLPFIPVRTDRNKILVLWYDIDQDLGAGKVLGVRPVWPLEADICTDPLGGIIRVIQKSTDLY